VLEDLWRLADTNTLEIKAVKAPAAKRMGQYSEQNVELRIAGSFNGVYQFLLDIENSQRITATKKIAITRSKGSDDRVQADLALAVFSDAAAH
jgi:Tfp pilus assembly protein PilO